MREVVGISTSAQCIVRWNGNRDGNDDDDDDDDDDEATKGHGPVVTQLVMTYHGAEVETATYLPAQL